MELEGEEGRRKELEGMEGRERGREVGKAVRDGLFLLGTLVSLLCLPLGLTLHCERPGAGPWESTCVVLSSTGGTQGLCGSKLGGHAHRKGWEAPSKCESGSVSDSRAGTALESVGGDGF